MGDRETIFIFTGDNGGIYEPLEAPMGCNYPYRGWKSTFEEGGIKAPTLLFSTQRTFEHRQIGKLFHITDWFATILGLGSIDVPSSNNKLSLDSLDFSGLLGQDRPEVNRQNFIGGVR